MPRTTLTARFDTLKDANDAIRTLLNAHLPARALRLVGRDGTQLTPLAIRPRRAGLWGSALGAVLGVTAGVVLAAAELFALHGSEALWTPAAMTLGRYGVAGGLLAGAAGGGLTGLGQWRMTPSDEALEGPTFLTVEGHTWCRIAHEVLDDNVVVRPHPQFADPSPTSLSETLGMPGLA